MANDNQVDMLTLREVTRLLHVHSDTVRLLCGNHLLFLEKAIDVFPPEPSITTGANVVDF